MGTDMSRLFRPEALAHSAAMGRRDRPPEVGTPPLRWLTGTVAALLLGAAGLLWLWRLPATLVAGGYARDATHVVVVGPAAALRDAVTVTMRQPHGPPLELHPVAQPSTPDHARPGTGEQSASWSGCAPIGAGQVAVETVTASAVPAESLGCVMVDVTGPRRMLWTFLAGGGRR